MLPAPVVAQPIVMPPRGRLPLEEDGRLQGRLWRGSSLSAAADPALSSGFTALDSELPGGGWPLRSVTELLTPQPGVLEWRLLAPALRGWWAAQALPALNPSRRQRQAAPALRTLLLVNPPHAPHLPGLQALGLSPSALVWVSAATPAQQLWATEQAVKSRLAVLAWLPEARPEQIRRLQVSALSSDAPVFLMRPESVRQQSSAAPLRLVVQPGEGWSLAVHLLKRRGPAHEGWLTLPAVPGAVEPLLTAAKRAPQAAPAPLSPSTERHDALARPLLHA
jgi:protein ImuA